MSKQQVVLVACKDERSLMRFPSNYEVMHGLVSSKPLMTDDDVICFLSEYLCLGEKNIPVIHLRWREELEGVELILASTPDSFVAPSDWCSLPDVLRSMGRGKPRLLYMKAMQVFAGGLEQQVDAVEVDQEVRDRLRELSEKED